jgi:hypothetical protein
MVIDIDMEKLKSDKCEQPIKNPNKELIEVMD